MWKQGFNILPIYNLTNNPWGQEVDWDGDHYDVYLPTTWWCQKYERKQYANEQ